MSSASCKGNVSSSIRSLVQFPFSSLPKPACSAISLNSGKVVVLNRLVDVDDIRRSQCPQVHSIVPHHVVQNRIQCASLLAYLGEVDVQRILAVASIFGCIPDRKTNHRVIKHTADPKWVYPIPVHSDGEPIKRIYVVELRQKFSELRPEVLDEI